MSERRQLLKSQRVKRRLLPSLAHHLVASFFQLLCQPSAHLFDNFCRHLQGVYRGKAPFTYNRVYSPSGNTAIPFISDFGLVNQYLGIFVLRLTNVGLGFPKSIRSGGRGSRYDRLQVRLTFVGTIEVWDFKQCRRDGSCWFGAALISREGRCQAGA